MTNNRPTARGGKHKFNRSALIGASFSSLVVVGLAGGVGAQPVNQAMMDECRVAMSLRSASTVTRVLEKYPDDPCMAYLLGGLDPKTLAKLPTEAVAGLSKNVLKLVPKEILAQFGIAGGYSGPRRAPTAHSQY